MCGDAKVKFNCTCPTEYFGRLCHKQRPTSCKEQLENDRRKNSGVYQLFDPRTNSLYQVFCDFRSADSIIWTLVESFSFGCKLEFTNKTFLTQCQKSKYLKYYCYYTIWEQRLMKNYGLHFLTFSWKRSNKERKK